MEAIYKLPGAFEASAVRDMLDRNIGCCVGELPPQLPPQLRLMLKTYRANIICVVQPSVLREHAIRVLLCWTHVNLELSSRWHRCYFLAVVKPRVSPTHAFHQSPEGYKEWVYWKQQRIFFVRTVQVMLSRYFNFVQLESYKGHGCLQAQAQ